MNNKSLNKLNNWLNRRSRIDPIELGDRFDRLTRPARSIFESSNNQNELSQPRISN